MEPAERVDRVERVTNLLLVLLDAGVPLSLDQIVNTVGGYPSRHDAYRQAFERDKRLLREQGVLVSVEPIPGGDMAGYRVRPEDYYLPDLDLTVPEQQALNLALAGVTMDDGVGQGAAWKLGVAESLKSVQSVPLASLPSAPALPLLHEAMRSRHKVSFSHRGRTRTVEPYGLLFRQGFWYVVGHDQERQAIRSFRVDRIDGLPVVLENQSFQRPSDFDAAAALPEDPWQMGTGNAVTARVWVDAVHAGMVEAELGSDSVVERGPDASVVVELRVTNVDAFRSWLFGLLDHAVALEPASLRDDVISWLRVMAGAAEP